LLIIDLTIRGAEIDCETQSIISNQQSKTIQQSKINNHQLDLSAGDSVALDDELLKQQDDLNRRSLELRRHL